MPNHRFVVERLLLDKPSGSARTISSVWLKIGFAGRIAAAERIAINAATDDAGLIRIRRA